LFDAQGLGPVSTEEAALPAERAPRGRGERRERGERNGDGARERNGDTGRELNGEAPSTDAAASDRPPRSGRDERSPRGERGERSDRGEGRRERRGDPTPRTDDEATAPEAALAEGGSAGSAPGDDQGAARREGDDRRGRSRDRYGRDRRERAPRDEGDVRAAETAAAESSVEAFVDRAPATAPIVVEAAAPAARSSRVLPKVQPFQLPLDELAQVAEGSGLHWVNSDAERVAQVRAAIEAEPKAVHVPRERPPAIVLDEGPLVLVETRRDLSHMTLPFEQAGREANVQH
jgi:ribonuclease E